jgi:hypothetical protein
MENIGGPPPPHGDGELDGGRVVRLPNYPEKRIVFDEPE